MSVPRHSRWTRLRSACDRTAAALIVALLVAYKRGISPWLGRHCRFEPTCSVYFREAVERHGTVRGTARGLARLCRCHPWHPGGYDPP